MVGAALLLFFLQLVLLEAVAAADTRVVLVLLEVLEGVVAIMVWVHLALVTHLQLLRLKEIMEA
jgi:hypothetical protein